MIRKFFKEYIGLVFSWLSSSLTIAICLSIVLFIFIKGIGEINIPFLFTEPVPTMVAEKSGGISTPIIGTFILTFIGILIAFPWSLATAVYLSEYASRNKFAGFFRLAIDVLSGVPTIVIAIFALAVFTNPQFAFLSSMIHVTNKAFGRSFFVAGITMAIMVLPYIIKTCEEAIRSVPESFKEASLALGATKWQTTIKVVVPSAIRGIITAITLGIGRIIGDTAIVWLTLGGTLRMTGAKPWWYPENWLSTLQNTGSTLTTYIFFTSPSGEGNLPEKAFGASLVLLFIIIVINLIIEFISRPDKLSMEE